MCELLTKEKKPSTHSLIELIGLEAQIPKEKRGSRFLQPFDKRFKLASINPDSDEDLPIDFLSFGGQAFQLRIFDISERFPTYQFQRNIYDGGTQIFFYPVPERFEFTGISCYTRRELEDIQSSDDLIVNEVSFLFGDNVVLGRDGFHLKR